MLGVTHGRTPLFPARSPLSRLQRPRLLFRPEEEGKDEAEMFNACERVRGGRHEH